MLVLIHLNCHKDKYTCKNRWKHTLALVLRQQASFSFFPTHSLTHTHREMVYEHTALQKLKSILGSCCHQGGCFIFDEQTQRSRFLFLSFHSSLAECTVTDIEITNIHLYGFSEDKLNFQREILMIEITLLYSCGNADVWKICLQNHNKMC